MEFNVLKIKYKHQHKVFFFTTVYDYINVIDDLSISIFKFVACASHQNIVTRLLK